jgi:hypothetical protein
MNEAPIAQAVVVDSNTANVLISNDVEEGQPAIATTTSVQTATPIAPPPLMRQLSGHAPYILGGLGGEHGAGEENGVNPQQPPNKHNSIYGLVLPLFFIIYYVKVGSRNP